MLFGLFVVLGLVEWQTHLIERLIGRWLNNHNTERQAWGTLWAQEEKTRQASKQLEGEAAMTVQLRLEADRVANFGELLALVPSGESLSISPAKFVGLYLSLPEEQRAEIIKSIELLAYYYTSDWRRALIQRQGDGGAALLLDAHDNILLTLNISPAAAAAISGAGRLQRGGLAHNSAFAGRIYLGEKFISYLFVIPESERNRIFPDPTILLSLPKPLLQVGLAPASNSGFAYIGFETSGAEGLTVISYPISDEAFERLSFALAWQGSDTLFDPVAGADEPLPGFEQDSEAP